MSEIDASGDRILARREVEGELMPVPECPSPVGMRRLGRGEKLEDLPIGTVVIWYATGPGWAYEDAEDRRQSGVVEAAYNSRGPNVIRAISTIYQENVVDLHDLGDSPVWVVEFEPIPGRTELPPPSLPPPSAPSCSFALGQAYAEAERGGAWNEVLLPNWAEGLPETDTRKGKFNHE